MPIRKEFRNTPSIEKDASPIYMTKAEFDQLKKDAEQKKIDLDKAAAEIADATQQSSETWHDNAPFDAAIENTGMLDKQYSMLINKISRVVVIEGKYNSEQVAFGTKVKLLMNLKVEKVFTVSGVSDLKAGKISIGSPLGEAILGKKEGDEGNFKVGNKESIVKILKIFEENS